jgi:hypothetical protein
MILKILIKTCTLRALNSSVYDVAKFCKKLPPEFTSGCSFVTNAKNYFVCTFFAFMRLAYFKQGYREKVHN